VADGVGGWRRRGIDPSAFSRSLMDQVAEASSPAISSSITHAGGIPKANPALEIMRTAFNGLITAYIRGEEEPFGSSTICVAALDKRSGWLDLANLGDSSAVLFRDGKVHVEMLRKQKRFNQPLQLTLDPSGEAKGNLLAADHLHVQVQDGDCLLVATDGLWDNLFMDQIVKRLHRHTLNDSETNDGLVNENGLAMDLADSARIISLRPFEANVTPFAVESKKAGEFHAGGKPDDITVIVARLYR